MPLALLGGVAWRRRQPPTPRQTGTSVANIKDAAKRLARAARRARSPRRALKFLEACYRTHMLASKYHAGPRVLHGAGLHALAGAGRHLSPRCRRRTRREMKAPVARDHRAIDARDAFRRSSRSTRFNQKQADSLKKAVDTHGMPLFIKSVFPESGKKQRLRERQRGPGARRQGRGKPQDQGQRLIP